MLLILAEGALGMLDIDKEVFPRFSPHQIEVRAVFPSAGPAEGRQRVGDIGRGKVDFIFKEGDEPYDIELILGSDQPGVLAPAATQLMQQIKAFPGVYDVIDSAEL